MDIAANLGQQRLSGERRRHRHVWGRTAPVIEVPGTIISFYPAPSWRCLVCDAPRDESKARAGLSARRLGHDQERRIERVYGPRKVGEFGDAIDLLGRDFMWQSKSTRGPVPRMVGQSIGDGRCRPIVPVAYISDPFRAMAALRADRLPLLIRSWVRSGVPVVDVIYVRWEDWANLHGWPCEPDEYIAMTGAHFLDTHGRDE